MASTLPMGRLLLVPGLGGSVLLAVVFRHVWRSRKQGRRPRGVALAGGVLALFNLVLAPLSWPAMSMMIRQLGANTEQLSRSVALELDATRLSTQRVVVLDARDVFVALYTPIYWAVRGSPLPRSWWTLSIVPRSPVFTRTGQASLELELPQGHFLATEAEQSVRGSAHRLETGAQVKLEGMTVTVLAADAEGPTRLGFEFDTPLEDPSLVFLRTREGGLSRFTPPPVGTRIDLSAPLVGAVAPGVSSSSVQ